MLLLRHGQSTWNRDGRWQGTADPPLTHLGRNEAAQAAATLAAEGGFHAVWSSDLRRARDTAVVLAAALDVPVYEEPLWREAPFGPWEGLTRAEVEAGWPGYLRANRRPEGAEQLDECIARGRRAVATLVAAAGPGTTVAVVSHGGLIRMLRYSYGLIDGAYPNLCGFWLAVDTEDGEVTWGDQILLGHLPAPVTL